MHCRESKAMRRQKVERDCCTVEAVSSSDAISSRSPARRSIATNVFFFFLASQQQ